MLTLDDKIKYTVHFKNLKLYLELGLILENVHRGIRFYQTDFLKPYIKLNTDLRKKATNDFEKDLFKLMNNSVFGKSIEDKRKHLNVKFAFNKRQAQNLIQKPNFEYFHILNEDVAIMKMLKSHVILDKPIAIGFTVLELSKKYMYSLHYNLFKNHYKDNINLIYTDTDSLIYEIKTNKYFEDLGDYFSPIMDFSNFDKKHKLYSDKNNKMIGYLKSEYGEKNMNEFVGLKSKLYSILYDETSNKKTAKGLQKTILTKLINHEHYREVILNQKLYSSSMKRIQSKDHNLQTIELTKLIFQPFDDKRFILNDGINSIPFGHYSIETDL